MTTDEISVQAACDVLAERLRQIKEEGWTPEHDDLQERGELIKAALSYCTRAAVTAELVARGMARDAIEAHAASASVPPMWPWDADWWKPKGDRRDLLRAAALIIAEIERLDRAAARAS